MFHTLKSTAAIATAAFAFGTTATAHAQFQLNTKVASVEAMADGIESRLSGNAFGWQFAIAQGGQYKTARAGGTARSAADNGGTARAMTPNTRYEVASVAKNTTAIQTMALLRRHNLTVKSSIDQFLPPEWQRGPGFDTKSVTFEHLLAHTSGLEQVFLKLSAGDNAQYGDDWDGLRFAVQKGTIPGSRSYFNTNYALLRVLNARMWHAAGGVVWGSESVEYETTDSNGDKITKTKLVWFVAQPDKKYHVRYALDHLKRKVLEPAGITNVTCQPSANPDTDGMAYKANATQASRGWVLRWPSDQCFGATGLRLNSIEMVRYLSHLRFGSILPKDAVAEMDSVLGGWDNNSSNGTFEKAGDLTLGAVHIGDEDPTGAGMVQVHTCVVTFPDGTAASVIVNSPLGGPDLQCLVLRKAWAAAR